MRPTLVVVMGVTGAGKSEIGELLARRLNVPFCEGDDLHSAANVAKMRAGTPLDDEDRAPWLARIGAWLRDCEGGGVVSCSALKRTYRDLLREGLTSPLRFVLLAPPRWELLRRLAGRTGHFMPPGLLDSQLSTLEPPGSDEAALSLKGCGSLYSLIDQAVAWLNEADTPPGDLGRTN